MTRSFSNLTAVADHYRSRGRHERFCVLVRNFSDAANAAADLRSATAMLSSCEFEPEKYNIPPDFLQMGAAALFGMLVIIYARATKARRQCRGAIDIEPDLHHDLLEDHRHIHNLRDDAIAHQGPGKRQGNDAWYGGLAILEFEDGFPSRSAFHAAGSLHQVKDYERLKHLIPEALQIAKQRAHGCADELETEIVRIADNSPEFKRRVATTLLTDDDFFKGSDGLNMMFSTPSGVSTSRIYQREVDC